MEDCNFCIDECFCSDDGRKEMKCGNVCWLGCDHYEPVKDTDCPLDKITKLEKQLTELRDKLRWIPVSERLPEELGWYLIEFESGYIDTQYIGENMDVRHAMEQAIKWMKIYKEDGE
jgi:hypothetical protein